jgi:hypothetical protein
VVAWFNGVLTARNTGNAEDLEKAAAYFEKIVDPATQPRHADGKLKYDFTRDFVVLAQLGRTLFDRSILDQHRPAVAKQFLLRSVDAYERVLAIDPEDIDAHYGLKQCFDLLAAGSTPATPPGGPVPVTMLTDLANAATKKDASPGDRAKAAAELEAAVTALGREKADPARPRLPTLRALVTQLHTAYHEEQDEGAKASLAAALAAVHRESHAMYKPDELAPHIRQRYREKHPAANAAAEAIVIYPTDREGAPGLEK